jgi:hypothetical protein
MFINKFETETNPDDEICSMIAKQYSKEIEYSQENLDNIYDMIYDNPAFSAKNVLSII